MSLEIVHTQSDPRDAIGVSLAIAGLLAENNVSAGDGVAGLMIMLLSVTRPDLAGRTEVLHPFIYDMSKTIAEWEPPASIQGSLLPFPEAPGGVSKTN